ncbi:conserved protein, unknown function [Hepatocystis sp. ex Piliocolobus tephrosceles]|nr:conserved protein, unknown function [Hepatocystis sp. ex Piliocolobus tephrosceles]
MKDNKENNNSDVLFKNPTCDYNKSELENKEDEEKKNENIIISSHLSDVSVSTVSNSTGIDSDLYIKVVKEIKREKRKKKREKQRERDREKEKKKKRQREKEGEEEKSASEINKKRKKKNYRSDDSTSMEKKKSRKKRSSRSSYDSERKYKKYSDEKRRKHKIKKSTSRTYNAYDENIPKDPFNPLLLAYEKKKKHDIRKNNYGRDESNRRWTHDKYESTSDENDVVIEKQAHNDANYKIDLNNVRKNLWKSKAGGVCLPQIMDNKDE